MSKKRGKIFSEADAGLNDGANDLMVIFPTELPQNEVEFTPVEMEIPEEGDLRFEDVDGGGVEIELTTKDILDHLDSVFGKYPDAIKRIRHNVEDGLEVLGDGLLKFHSIKVQMKELYEKNSVVRNFVDLVSLGAVCGPGYTTVVSFPYKMVYRSKRVENSIDVHQTKLGPVWKNLPMIANVSASEINSVCSKFYGKILNEKVRESGGDYFGYFLSVLPEREVVRKIEDMFSLKDVPEMELAAMICSKRVTGADLKKLLEAGYSKTKLARVVALSKLIR